MVWSLEYTKAALPPTPLTESIYMDLEGEKG